MTVNSNTRSAVEIRSDAKSAVEVVRNHVVAWRRAGLPSISSFTCTPDHYRDTDRALTYATQQVTSGGFQGFHLTYDSALPTESRLPGLPYAIPNPWRTGSAGGNRQLVVRIGMADISQSHLRMVRTAWRTDPSTNAIYNAGTDGIVYAINNFTYWVIPIINLASLTTFDFQVGTRANLADLVLSFAVTGSTRNVVTQMLADGTHSNVPLSPSTGATISAPLQDAHFDLTSYNSSGQSTHARADYTYWTAPTIALGAPRSAPFTGAGGVIYIRVTRGGNPSPSVSVVASDGHGSGPVSFTSTAHPEWHDYQISGAQTGTPRTVTYTFTATSQIGSQTRTATASTSFTWPA